MFSRLVKQLAEKEGVTEVLKAENQILNAAMEIVSSDLICAEQAIEKAAVKRRRLFFFGKYSRSHKAP